MDNYNHNKDNSDDDLLMSIEDFFKSHLKSSSTSTQIKPPMTTSIKNNIKDKNNSKDKDRGKNLFYFIFIFFIFFFNNV